MIVDKAIYLDGEREEIDGDISEAFERAKARGNAFLWVGLFEPTHEEFDLIVDELQLHPLAVEDAIDAHQRPKLELYGDTLFAVLKTLRHDDAKEQQPEIGEIMLFVGDDFVITVRHGSVNPLAAARRRVETEKQLLDAGPPGVLYAVCDLVVDNYLRLVRQYEADVIDAERLVFQPGGADATETIYELKRDVLQFRIAVDPLVPVMEDLAHGRIALCAGLSEYFRDVLDHVLRVDRQVEAQSELLTGALAANLSLVTMQQNIDLRKISAWAAIVAVPTMIAGIYGMNFDHMPELHWSFGYPLIVGVMIGACLVLHRKLRRSGWL
ncbi:magnesium and cobalt transport protein CorA [Jiangella anatolica]|uniref:Magnesium transporter CorA n=1 Tax=Jiangella anatolica TaxID=2670374 RepID=A0A2W2CSY8_9ACTN|nr:magnesium and cobalt transport protein CorA [Jiangella anatolica]PZF83273.1 magnesium transporter CorA [Jiangella anatolica]